MSVSRRILKNIFSLSIAEISSKGLAFLYTIYLIRTIGPEGNGILNFAKSIVQYFLIVVALGFDQVGIREIAKNKNLISNYVNDIISIRLILASISYILLIITVKILIFTKPELYYNQHIIYIYGLTLFANAIMLNWVFQGIEKMEIIAIRSVVIYVLNFLGIILLVKSNEDITIAILVITFSIIITSVWMLIYYYKFYGKIKLHFDFNRFILLTKQALSIGLIFLIAILYNNIDITMLGILRNDFETGLYSAAHQVIVFAILPSFILQGAFFPQFANRETFVERNIIISKYAKMLAFFGFLISGLLFVLSDDAKLFFGNKYIGTELVLKLLSFTILIQFIISIYFSPLIAWKQERKVIVANISGLVINLILNLILIPIINIYGAAIATILCEFTVLLVVVYIFKQNHNNLFFKDIFSFLPIIIISILPILIFREKFNFIFSLLLIVILYVGTSLVFKLIRIDEIKLMIKK